MFGIFKRRPPEEGLLSQADAKAIIEAELGRRNWKFPSSHGYSLKRRDGRMVWRGMGGAFYTPGGGRLMFVDIDAKTGDVIAASDGRPPDNR
jgi:hypothetical protein